MELLSKRGEGFPRGSEWSRANIPLVASSACWGLANAGTLTCEDSSCKGHVLFFLRAWLAQLTTRTHSNVAAVALANKLARMAGLWHTKNEPYRPHVGRHSYRRTGLQMTPG
jgi:hypothetical protein